MLDIVPSFDDLVKYVLQGVGVAVAAFYIPQRKTKLQEIGLISLVAALSFWLLDKFAPEVGRGMRQGAGFGVGYGMVGGDGNAVQPVAPTPNGQQPQTQQLQATATQDTVAPTTETKAKGTHQNMKCVMRCRTLDN